MNFITRGRAGLRHSRPSACSKVWLRLKTFHSNLSSISFLRRAVWVDNMQCGCLGIDLILASPAAILSCSIRLRVIGISLLKICLTTFAYGPASIASEKFTSNLNCSCILVLPENRLKDFGILQSLTFWVRGLSIKFAHFSCPSESFLKIIGRRREPYEVICLRWLFSICWL